MILLFWEIYIEQFFSDFDLSTLLDSFVNTDHFIHFPPWAASTFRNLITQRKKIQFPCRNLLFYHRQHHHNY